MVKQIQGKSGQDTTASTERRPQRNALYRHLKALVFLCAFEESVDCHLLSSFCDDSNLHISLFKYVLSTMGVSKESISKFLIGNRFHVKLRILSLYSNIYLYFILTKVKLVWERQEVKSTKNSAWLMKILSNSSGGFAVDHVWVCWLT